MRYLGSLSGTGLLTCKGETIGRAAYDFDSYENEPSGIVGCGEIELPAAILKGIFGRTGLQLLTDDGLQLGLRFSEKTLPTASETAHVDVTGGLEAVPARLSH